MNVRMRPPTSTCAASIGDFCVAAIVPFPMFVVFPWSLEISGESGTFEIEIRRRRGESEGTGTRQRLLALIRQRREATREGT